MSEIDLTMRRAGATDAKLLATLAAATFYEAYFEQDDSRDLAAYCVESFSPQQMKTELEDPAATFFLAEFRGKAVGYAKLREDSTAPGVENLNAAEIQRIYVLEKMKGKGVGLELMRKCFAEAVRKNYEHIWLGVWRYNPSALKFYAKFGFQKVGELEFKYGDGFEINYVLVKKL